VGALEAWFQQVLRMALELGAMKLEEQAQAEAEGKGEDQKGEKAKPKANAQYSFTDPESRIRNNCCRCRIG